ncbi:uncharacterized protein SAPINGB_P000438 [Magnusiomyces paraingens]|uniref:Enoyl-CoA hydratase n=1 Tax=Magnusiomyces paraingens TaxID=2606893 RepID=A0A5E8B4D8_9ASCO|nr:uncharacterized protein SAPINGB_P000438 [Saprochaete ingens]VVT44503.1 unnamed protein product [Saprochaete ingens]
MTLQQDQQTFLNLAETLQLEIVVDFPHPHVVRVRLNAPKRLNCVPAADHAKFDKLWTLFEELPSLRVVILTGTGRVFCAGADLKGWRTAITDTSVPPDILSDNGFLGISDRTSKKPFIAALNGPAYGGGTETLLNCDMVVAVASATISLPEPRRSVAAIAGALPRLGRLLPLQRAMEIALLAEPVSAVQMHTWGIVTRVEPTTEDVQATALALAKRILLSAPEALAVTLSGIRRGYETTAESLKENSRRVYDSQEAEAMNSSENIGEGLAAFAEKRTPQWKL